MSLTWKDETAEHGYPFRKWLQAELEIKLSNGKVSTLVLGAFELKTVPGEPLPYYWGAEATFETYESSSPGEQPRLESICIFIQQPARPSEPGHLADERAAKAACINGAKLALLGLINDLRLT